MKVKTCVTCKYMESGMWFGTGFAKCKYPDAISTNVVSGKTERMFCSLARANNQACGQDGKWWEVK